MSVDRPKAVGPFFILGCVRSGTTMLRDALRRHPHFASPEETHFYRWAEPFGTEAYTRVVTNNPVLKQHRKIDGISEKEFGEILDQAQSRRELYVKYMTAYMRRAKPEATRWFDKTPQNIYGALLAATQFPAAKFIHIVRNPLNVASSLRIGKVMSVQQLVGASNYWSESVSIIGGLKKAFPSRVHELRYEDFVDDPDLALQKICTYLGEPFDMAWFSTLKITASDHQDSAVLSPEERQAVSRICAAGMDLYGYTARG